MKAVLLIIVSFALGLLAMYFLPGAVEAPSTGSVANPVLTDSSVLDVFIFTVQEEVNKKQGRPAQGYKPDNLLRAFPGLTITDFNSVLASDGRYEVAGGELVFVPDTSGLLPTNPDSISRAGYEIMLTNVAVRNNINMQSNGTLTDIMRVMTRE
jgi:hypothetical protein